MATIGPSAPLPQNPVGVTGAQLAIAATSSPISSLQANQAMAQAAQNAQAMLSALVPLGNNWMSAAGGSPTDLMFSLGSPLSGQFSAMTLGAPGRAADLDSLQAPLQGLYAGAAAGTGMVNGDVLSFGIREADAFKGMFVDFTPFISAAMSGQTAGITATLKARIGATPTPAADAGGA